MTTKEYRKKLKKLNDKQFNKFKKDFGGDYKTREEYVRNFVDNPEHERHICQLLDMKTEEEKVNKAITRSTIAAIVSAVAIVVSVGFSLYIWYQGESTRRPILAIRKGNATQKELRDPNKLQINLRLTFLNIGKHPAGDVRFRSCFGPLFDPNQLKLGMDQTAANTIYPENEYNPWEQLSLPLTDLPKIRDSLLFYYCRLDYKDPWEHNHSYPPQDFYFIYNIDRKKLQDATSEYKQHCRTQPQNTNNSFNGELTS